MAFKEYPLRLGYWSETPWGVSPFTPIGLWVGPEFESLLPGSSYEQQLEEGLIKFTVNCLYRPDLGRKDQLESILYLTHIDDGVLDHLFEYNTWSKI